jgi:ribulose-5-phosphate 4-epimerase/fuculose-1-phosphate aldolase
MLLAACGSGGADWPSDRAAEQAAAPRTVDAATRTAAASLSVANSGVIAADTQLGRAVQCAATIEASAELLRTSPLVGEAEYREILRAGRLFSDRVPSLAAGEGVDNAEAAEQLEEARAEAGDDPQQALRTALGCLRSLANGGA